MEVAQRRCRDHPLLYLAKNKANQKEGCLEGARFE